MREFGKRLSWRLTAGLVTIALGALAAAQSQRQDFVDASAAGDVPQLDQPGWAASLPEPIAPHPVMSGDHAQADAMVQAAYQFSASGPNAERSNGDHPSTDFSPVAIQAAYELPANNATHHVAMVDHNAEIAPPPSDAAGANPDVSGPDASGPDVSGPGISMALPEMVMPGAEPNLPPSAGPSMGLPEVQIAMPEAVSTHSPEATVQPDPANSPAGSSMSGSEGARPMAELQFEQGPDLALPEAAGRQTFAPQQDMMAPQGFAEMPAAEAPASQVPAMGPGPAAEPMEPAYNNSLRSSASMAVPGNLPDLPQPQASPQFNPMRTSATMDSPAMMGQPEPSGQGPQSPLPQPGVVAANSGYDTPAQYQPPASYQESPQYPNASQYQETAPYQAPAMSGVPAQFAGHQRQPQAGMPPGNRMLPGQQDISNNLPGDRRLEGAQTPSVVIQKRAPAEVKVGKPATFVVQVQNVGSADALNVQVFDRIPTGMQLVDSTPQPQMQGDNLLWSLGDMAVGAERSITMQLIPMEEGELGSVARVTFEAAASVRTRSTRPELKITQQAPQQVLIGQQLEIELAVGNIGTGGATNVVLQVDVPSGLDHPQGRELDNLLGDLRPGEERREVLRLKAVEPGMIQNTVTLVADDAQPVTHTVNVEVIAPSIAVALNGPSRRYLERPATYEVNIENQGTAPATNVEIKAFLDRGFTFVSTENNGHYDPNQHAVIWSIANLPAGQLGSVPVTLMPIEEGNQAIRLEAMADLNVRGQSESVVQVESQAELTFSIADTADPIELGSETVYEIRVKNSGSRNDTNVQVQLQLPPGLELLDADSEVRTNDRGGVMLAPQKQMAAGADAVYRLRVRGVQPDTHLVKAIVTSDQSRVPVTKEESTMVYADR